MIYRDQGESCPRCAGDLIDAGSARACEPCHGLWVTLDVLAEMATAMQVPRAPPDLTFVSDPRPALPCPSCSERMGTFTLFDVPIDKCDKHGVWFDRDELQVVLIVSAMNKG